MPFYAFRCLYIFQHLCWKLFVIFLGPILHWFSYHRSIFLSLIVLLAKNSMCFLKFCLSHMFYFHQFPSFSSTSQAIPVFSLNLFQTGLKFVTTSYIYGYLHSSNPIHLKLHLPAPQISFYDCFSTFGCSVIWMPT